MESKLVPFSGMFISHYEKASYHFKCRLGLCAIAVDCLAEKNFRALKYSLIIGMLCPALTKLGFFVFRPYSPFQRFGVGLSMALPIINIIVQMNSCLRKEACEPTETGNEVLLTIGEILL